MRTTDRRFAPTDGDRKGTPRFFKASGCLFCAWMLAAPAVAHDVWLGVPATAQPGTLVEVRLFQGHGGASETLGRNDRRIERFVARDPDGEESPLPGRHGSDPAGFIRPDRPGLWTMIYQSRPATHQTAAEVFEHHLAQEGLDDILEVRRREGTSATGGREIYSRHLRALLPVGSAGDWADAPAGLAAELVVDRLRIGPTHADPEVELRLWRNGAAVAGALVDFHPVRPRPEEAVVSRRTDGEGRVIFPLTAPGPHVATVVIVDPIEKDRQAEARWRTYFVATTFPVPDPARSP